MDGGSYNVGWAVSSCDFLVGCLGAQGQWLYWNNIVGSTWYGGGGGEGFGCMANKEERVLRSILLGMHGKAFCTSIETTIHLLRCSYMLILISAELVHP